MGFRDDLPTMPDGREFDGRQLLTAIREGNNPFQKKWDFRLLIQEVEEVLHSKILDIPMIDMGSNNYGFHFRLQNQSNVIVRLARGDVNMPGFDGFPLDKQVSEIKFEADTYKLLEEQHDIKASRLLYHRVPVRTDLTGLQQPTNIQGRHLMLFERRNGKDSVWRELDEMQQVFLLTQAANIRVALFNFTVPPEFSQKWFLERLFEQKPASMSSPVAETRDFCLQLFISKINATIRNIGDMIGWESDNATVGPVAAAAKQSLLHLIPHVLPKDSSQGNLYRLVLEHGDFGIHNMTIAIDPESRHPSVTSLYDWETGCITPAILSDPKMAVIVDLKTDDYAAPTVTRVRAGATAADCETYLSWATHYVKTLFSRAPKYREAIKAGKDARHLWFALRDWRGQDPEGYFGALGEWAEKRMKELGVE